MILGIESSCDESALALYDPRSGLIGEWIHSQIVKHSEYGGVVPDIAVSEHLDNFSPLLSHARKEHNLARDVSKIAVTYGPGLVGCLGVGISVAKSLGVIWDIPVVGVNHLRGHAYSPFMALPLENDKSLREYLPHLGLLVSGGNTVLFSLNEKSVIGADTCKFCHCLGVGPFGMCRRRFVWGPWVPQGHPSLGPLGPPGPPWGLRTLLPMVPQGSAPGPLLGLPLQENKGPGRHRT